jgi:hypothetical protein
MKALPLALVLIATTALNTISAELPDSLTKKLSATILEHCPDALIEVSDSGFTAKHGTMMFTMHGKSKTGEVFPQTYQEEGPNFRGFLLNVSLKEGAYEGAAVVPQTLQGPYFPTFIDAPRTDDGVHHYWVRFSFGRRLDPKLRDAIFDAIPKSKFQPGGAANRSQPIPTETDTASVAAGSDR